MFHRVQVEPEVGKWYFPFRDTVKDRGGCMARVRGDEKSMERVDKGTRDTGRVGADERVMRLAV